MHATACLLLGQGTSLHTEPVAVGSACFGVTDKLVEAVLAASSGEDDRVAALRRKLHQWHISSARELIDSSSPLRRATCEHIEETFEMFFDRPLEEVATKAAYDATDMDTVSSMGERLSNFIISQYMRSVAGDDAAAYIAGDEVVITDGKPGNSSPLLAPTRELMQERVLPLIQRGTVPLITGFFGRSEDGLLTTFGRGGSDLTAALVGYALDADEVALYKVEYNKDDEGFLEAWTSGWEGIVHDADVTTTIPRITYQVAAELAHFGKKVLHPSTVHPAVEKAIDLKVLNSLNHTHPGTLIGAAEHDSETDGLVSTITKTRLADYEQRHERRLDLDSGESDWGYDPEQSTLIAMVGLNIMEHKAALLSRVEDDLRAAGIEYAVPRRVNGSSHNVSIVVPASRTKDALGILHAELVAGPTAAGGDMGRVSRMHETERSASPEGVVGQDAIYVALLPKQQEGLPRAHKYLF